jgi:protein-S-isoprenylcysteine O-methyltransferase Ste14
MEALQSRVAIVTGGSLGIGKAIALDLAANGADVAINYRKHDAEAKELVAQIEAMGRRGLAVQADVASFADAQRMVDTVIQTLGRLDILVNNAGINRDGVIWKMTEEQWDQVIATNLKGYFNYIRAAAPVFKEQGSGRIVNITHQDWSGWVLPVPDEIGLLLVTITGSASLLAVVNLALKGFGAPFFIALSQKLAVDWLYAWTRNPMLLAALAFFLSLGIWFQSALFVLWVLFIVIPAFLFFVKVYEERELEFRFGASYLA